MFAQAELVCETCDQADMGSLDKLLGGGCFAWNFMACELQDPYSHV